MHVQSDALEREDVIEKLLSDEKIHFWRNTTTLNWKLLHAVKCSKHLRCDACSKEIQRLNRKLEIYEGTIDLIDLEDLKKNVKAIMAQNDRHTKAAHKKRKNSLDSIDRGDDSGCLDYDDVTNIENEASYIVEEVVQMEKEIDEIEEKK
uniref:Uncharacterized protein n=1 Tax=Asparagus officinalis TaxID=4686 RepID=Q2AA77_ASPOF|nr:hypothetical protein 18.t00007 [Asparagus officinalis]